MFRYSSRTQSSLSIFVESIDFIVKASFISPPLMKIRLLEGSFVNLRGGQGNHMETDLAMENSVCNRKENSICNRKALIKQLDANKKEKPINRVCMAADTVAYVTTELMK